jgi:ABC-2 type transport system ATP-binding protein
MTSESGGEESTPPKVPARAPRRRPAAGTAKTAAAAAAPTTTTSASTRTARSATSKTGTKPTTTRTKTTVRPTKASPPAKQPESQAAVTATMTIETTERIQPVQPPKPSVLTLTGLHKRFGDIVAVDGVTLEVAEGSFYGIVGPNGAGKTTTLSMVTGLLRPDAGRIVVHGVDVWNDPVKAKRSLGVLPDKLRMFDRLTGAQLLHYAGSLRGLSGQTVRSRSADLARAFGIEDALDRLVADYSAGMTKKIALAAAMIHSPRLLVLDEPFESVDPVSAANVIDILQRYVAAGGTVVVSSHGMDLIQRVCDSVAIIVRGQVLAAGTIDQVRGEQTLEERFVELAGGRKAAEGMEWLHSFSD